MTDFFNLLAGKAANAAVSNTTLCPEIVNKGSNLAWSDQRRLQFALE
jgi:hypothetical protein